jgi:hypothetical protein
MFSFFWLRTRYIECCEGLRPSDWVLQEPNTTDIRFSLPSFLFQVVFIDDTIWPHDVTGLYSVHKARLSYFETRLSERLLFFGLVLLTDIVIDNVIVFSHSVRIDKAEAQAHHHNSHPMADAALARRISCCRAGFLALFVFSHRNLPKRPVAESMLSVDRAVRQAFRASDLNNILIRRKGVRINHPTADEEDEYFPGADCDPR